MRHSNRRYSSIIKNWDILHKYLVVPVTAHTHVRRKSIEKKKRKEKTEKKEKGYEYYIPIEDHPVSSRSRRSLLLSVVGNIYGCYMPRHGDLTVLMSRMTHGDALGPNCTDSSRGRAFGTNCGRMAILCPTRVVCKKNRESISELRFLTQ